MSPEEWASCYRRVWKFLLLEFRGWSGAEVEAWAEHNNYLQGDDSVDGWISHDPVAACVVREILPDHLREKVKGRANVEMWRDMEDALWPSSTDWIEPADADWPLIRSEVARVVAKWEARVAAAHDQNDDGLSGGVIHCEV